jgi:hypothetical protein
MVSATAMRAVGVPAAVRDLGLNLTGIGEKMRGREDGAEALEYSRGKPEGLSGILWLRLWSRGGGGLTGGSLGVTAVESHSKSGMYRLYGGTTGGTSGSWS